jgi:hypothetical protein
VVICRRMYMRTMQHDFCEATQVEAGKASLSQVITCRRMYLRTMQHDF